MVSTVGEHAETEASLIGKSESRDKNKQIKPNHRHQKVEERRGELNSWGCVCEKQAGTSASHEGNGGNLGTMAHPHHSHTQEARPKGQAGNTSQLTAYSKEPGLPG